MYSSTGGGDSRGLSVVHGEKVDSVALDTRENLQLRTSDRSVSSEVLAMLHILCSIYRDIQMAQLFVGSYNVVC